MVSLLFEHKWRFDVWEMAPATDLSTRAKTYNVHYRKSGDEMGD